MGTLVSRDELVERVADLRRSGRTVAFANGCFDLLHVGHIRYLEGTAQQADVLVVAVSDDDSVRRLEGDGRSILAVEHRAELLAALRSVDFVVVCSEPELGPLLDALRPDVRCKATDTDRSTRDLLARIAGSSSTPDHAKPASTP